MEHNYLFWADLFDTYQSLEPNVQLAWLAVLFFLALFITFSTIRILELLLTRRGRRRGGEEVHRDEPPAYPPPLLSSPPPRRRGPTYRIEESGGLAGDLLQPPDTKQLPWYRDVDPRLRGDDN